MITYRNFTELYYATMSQIYHYITIFYITENYKYKYYTTKLGGLYLPHLQIYYYTIV